MQIGNQHEGALNLALYCKIAEVCTCMRSHMPFQKRWSVEGFAADFAG